MNKPILGYFSHSPKSFNTEREVREYDFISRFYKSYIISPNIHLVYKKMSVYNQYFQLIDLVDFMIVSAFNGTIGRGSYYEVKQALERNIPIHEIYPIGQGFKIRKVVAVNLLPVNNITNYAKLLTIPLKNISYKNLL
jgi:hypothetical protein